MFIKKEDNLKFY